jgi:hypothetical protein
MIMRKKIIGLLAVTLAGILLLAGCGSKPTMETITDVPDTPVVSTVKRIQLQLPPELSAPTLEDEETGSLYLCDDYSVTLQTVEAGDLQKTIRNLTGMDKNNLQIIATRQGDIKRYQWVWSTTGENGVQVGRGCVLDDGVYHYVLTAQADEKNAPKVQEQWKEIFASFTLATEREEISTGS